MSLIQATLRNTQTRGELSALRKKGEVPGIIYGGENPNEKISLSKKEIKSLLDKEIIFHEQDCSKPWKIESNSLDLVFTSNFFEHLPNKESLDCTMGEVKKALKPGGRLIAMGPNISVLKGQYWDFWDHHVALSDQSLCELLDIHDFTIEKSYSKFLPYNMVRVKERPLFLVSLYIRFPFLWKIFGKQFLVVSKK